MICPSTTGAVIRLPAAGTDGLARFGSDRRTRLSVVVRWLTEHRPAGGEDGQGLAEYALILALIAIVAILSLIFLGDTINTLMSNIGETIADNT